MIDRNVLYNIDLNNVDFWDDVCDGLIERTRTRNKKVKSKYKRNYNEGVLGVQVETRPDGHPIFITQHNVELYFEHAVVGYFGQEANTKAIFNALNSFRKNYESPQDEALQRTPSILQSIDQQQINAQQSQKYIDSDPHKGIKDIMSTDEVHQIINTIQTQRPDAIDLSFSFLWGINAGVRGSSSRAFTLCVLYMSTGFGPERSAPNNKTITCFGHNAPEIYYLLNAFHKTYETCEDDGLKQTPSIRKSLKNIPTDPHKGINDNISL
jgi:hypothetical protein